MNPHILFNHDDKFFSFQSLLTSKKSSFYVRTVKSQTDVVKNATAFL